MEKSDIGKIVFNTKESRYGRFFKISDYTEFETDFVTKEEKKTKNKFYSSSIFCKELVGYSSNLFWKVIYNFQCCFTKQEIEAHFDKKINELKDELDIWEKAKKRTLEEATDYLVEFKDLKQSTNYFDYDKKFV